MSVIGLRHYDDDDDYSDDVDDDDSVEEDDDDDDNGEYVCFSTLNTGAQAKTTLSVQRLPEIPILTMAVEIIHNKFTKADLPFICQGQLGIPPELPNGDAKYSEGGVIKVVPDTWCENMNETNIREHPYLCHVGVMCNADAGIAGDSAIRPSSATMKQTAVQSCNNSEVRCVAKNASGVIIFSSAFKMIQLPNTG
ncbi:hypothetical protein DPMN_132000 [Dreissena polymorpha]|uniref:Uncharacterized protein n=1 Tax=Dreissena polymorpha TaxID=45954 RepID=A0A9D4FXH4_DREPO|nr:hypothetical protein DPMN_132000 [Dreissena polymorpha]